MITGTEVIANLRTGSRAWSQYSFLLVLSILLFSAFPLFPETVRVGTTTTPPLVYSKEDGTAGGLFIDILKYVADKEGWKLQYKNGSLNECLTWVLSGEIDIDKSGPWPNLDITTSYHNGHLASDASSYCRRNQGVGGSNCVFSLVS